MTEIETQIPLTQKRRRSWVSWTALIAIIVAMAAWFQLFHQQKRSTHNFSQLQSSFHQTLTDTAQLGQTANDLQSQISRQNDQIQALQAAFNRLQAANSGYETDIALQQIDRYLIQANLSLTFNHDIAGAITLLQAADQRLNALPEPSVIPLRQAIVRDLIKLQAISNLDYISILTKLTALRDQAASIPLFAINAKTQVFQPKTNSLAVQNGTKITWEKTWQTTLQTLKSLIIIRNRDEAITPLISETQEQFLRQNLQLIFQQAQWAVLQHQSSVYQYSLTQASEWVQRYFADNDQATIALQTNIAELKKVNLSPQIPDITFLINQLHTLQLQIHKSRTLTVEKSSLPEKVDEEDEEETPTKPSESKGDVV